eukprot:CAMPEP_0206135340 /NCGR_PEP_ID=MMETSP1473-20131121/653_1 /ASSEMBLY_ACC=CAM_ASM_001109 /TAXON_ID=1461547 /ORGANISM="Stichococcus sp, Strain RCC1054" /LENGTH=92 /DNA_ID=CAMNT_0053527169 /DNA_START=335 /DNA_END=611 /DNA_ORIENTATION=-
MSAQMPVEQIAELRQFRSKLSSDKAASYNLKRLQSEGKFDSVLGGSKVSVRQGMHVYNVLGDVGCVGEGAGRGLTSTSERASARSALAAALA